MAMAVTDQTIRSIYLDLAKEWTAIAEEAEELERRFAHPKNRRDSLQQVFALTHNGARLIYQPCLSLKLVCQPPKP
jgi:hypothetical protein